MHGEVWSRPWAVERASASELVLTVQGGGQRFYALRRTLRLAPGAPRVELEYELASHDAREIPFVYCLHALFSIEPGMRVEIPFATPVGVVPDPSAHGFEPRAEKRFVRAARGEAALVGAGGREALRLHFDPAQLPFVGVWENYGRWSGAGTAPYFNLAIEPGVGDDDSLERALANGTHGTLAPGAVRRWWIALELAS